MNKIFKVRLLIVCSLIFSFAQVTCRNEKHNGDVVLSWENEQVKKIHLPLSMISNPTLEEARKDLRVTLAKPGAPAILGEYSIEQNDLVFEPAIPFTPGLSYEVNYKNSVLKTFTIPNRGHKAGPHIVDIYPREDSLPENLLKIYISFSHQMQEGVSAQYVALVKDGKDTLSNVFLDLQPELWNDSRTLLTLWLNPGRIKRNLIPNREEGPPLIPGARYEIVIKPGWRNAFGDSVKNAFQKNFVTIPRDTVMPDIDDWTIQSPRSGTVEPLIVKFNEPMDYLVIKNSIFITDKDYNAIYGKVEVANDERVWLFVPDKKWESGNYHLDIEPRVEDLAGNNLERLFDKDLTKPGPEPDQRVFVVRTKEFTIH